MSAPVIYHTGFLANDRAADAELDKVARQWLDAFEDGRAILVQRRLEPGKYEYIAHVVEPAEMPAKVRDRDGLGLPDKPVKLPRPEMAPKKAA